jgi:Fur family transcriptional regulator, zinc uptake regulator
MNIDRALSILKEEGYKHTGQRDLILQYFSQQKHYMTAKDVLRFMKESYPGVSFDTIYRNLYMLTEIGILESTELNGEKHFRFSCDTNEHHHHFICTDCGKSKSVHVCPMENVGKELADFEIASHKFEIYGRCPECLKTH